MNRFFLLLLGLGFLACQPPSTETAAPDRPNVLFLFADDQRASTLLNEAIRTPNLDRLRARGLHFTEAYIMGGDNGAVCAPSRAMLHTGRRLGALPEKGFQIPEEFPLLGEVLQSAGYQTFGTGKWHNTRSAFNRNFQAGDAIFMGGMGDQWTMPLYHYHPDGVYQNSRLRIADPFHNNTLDTLSGEYAISGKHASEVFADAAIEFLQSQEGANDPFFCYVSFTAPHDPRTVPAEYLAGYDVNQIELPPNFLPEHPFDNGQLIIRDEQLAATPRQPDAIRQHLLEYYAIITHLDAQIGRILDALEASGNAENTIVVFAGDNGLAVGQHGLLGKQNLYQHSVNVPLLISGPGLPQNEQRSQLCYLTDLFPTLCELTGAATPSTLDGYSLMPVIEEQRSIRDTLHFQYKDLQGSIRTGKDKLIRYWVDGEETLQLFDLEADPWEMNDLAPQAPAQAATLKEALLRWDRKLGLAARK
ncbi:MAG: sulfatase-like hydrolase/transferase [Bacteroidota bacterium]